MQRRILDGDLRRWEVYATTDRYGFPDPARVVFRCTSDPRVRARAVTIEGDKSEAEACVSSSSAAALSEMLGRASEID